MYYRTIEADGGDYVTEAGVRVSLMRCAVPAVKSGWKQYASEANAIRGFGLTPSPLPEPDPQKEQRIAELKQMLADTDYVAAKLAEVDGDARTQMLADYAEVLANRKAWREEISHQGD